jgi:hypothetical protein
LWLLAGNQIINPSVSSAIACDVSVIAIRLNRAVYGGEGASDIRGIVGKQFDFVQEWDPIRNR